MAQIEKEGFVVTNGLVWAGAPGFIWLDGQLGCLGGIVITVEKTLVVVDDNDDVPTVQTSEYNYNASVFGRGNIERHDNAHVHPGHSTAHHWHEFDYQSDCERRGSPFEVKNGDWITLGEFIRKIGAWFERSGLNRETVGTIDPKYRRRTRVGE